MQLYHLPEPFVVLLLITPLIDHALANTFANGATVRQQPVITATPFMKVIDSQMRWRYHGIAVH